MRIVREAIARRDLVALAERQFDDMVKADDAPADSAAWLQAYFMQFAVAARR